MAVNPQHHDERKTTRLAVAVDLGTLVESLHVSPRAPAWVSKLVARRALACAMPTERGYQPPVPGSPLNGPTTLSVIQPP